jgi:transcriptional regulator
MFTPNEFDVHDPEALWKEACRRRFGSLVVLGDAQPALSVHLPLLFDRDTGRLLGHVAARNPIASAVDRHARVLVVMQCGDAYISPRWYRSEPDVPTWNYVVIEFEGLMQRLSPARTLQLLTASALAFENDAGLPPPAWVHTDMPDQALAAHLARAVVGFEVEVARVSGAAKLSQDKVAEDLDAVMQALEASPQGGARDLAALMRRWPIRPRDPQVVPSTMPPGL